MKKGIVTLIAIVVLLYVLYKQWILSRLDYSDFVHLENILSPDEITFAQQCTENNNTLISTPCFASFHKTIFANTQDILKKKGKHIIHIGHARFSNNNNNDGLVFHRDIKPHFRVQMNESYPAIYTMICYLDNASLYLGNKYIMVKPGDVVIFNAFHMHRAGDLTIWKNKNRRILQWFHVCFDEVEKRAFYERHSFQSSYKVPLWMKNIYYCFIDIKYLVEYYHLLLFFYPKCDTDYVTFRNESFFCETVEGVRYYREF